MEKCAQLMLPVAVFSARLARRNLDILSTSTSLLDSLRRFLLLSAAGALDDEEFFIIEGSVYISLSDWHDFGVVDIHTFKDSSQQQQQQQQQQQPQQ